MNSATSRQGAAGRVLWRREIWATLSLGLPLVGAQLAQIAINTTDVLMIGWLGAEDLAAAVLAFNLFILFWFFGMGTAQAVIPLAAKARGKRAARDLRRTVRMGLWVVTLYCLPVWVILWNTEEILIVLGQDPEISRMAAVYMRALQWSMLPSLGIMALRGFLTVMERTQFVLWATIGGAILNAIIDYVLIFGHFGAPRMELVGAGIASFGTSLATFLLLAVYVARQRQLRRYAIFGRIWRSDWPVFFQIVRVGWPIGATIVAESSLFTASAIMMGWLGTIPLAAHGIALQIAAITFMVPVGFSQAGMTRVGLAAGKSDVDGVGRAGWAALTLTLVFMGCAAVVFWTMPEPLVALFLDFDNPQAVTVLGLAATYLGVAAVFQLVDGAQIIGASNLRGLGDTKVPLYFALFGYWVVGITLSYGLGFGAGMEGVGIWWGLAGGLAVVGVLANHRFARRHELGLVQV